MNVVIVGGGISGISAAKVILKAGHRATIIESAAAPGGLMARIANCRVGFKTFYDEIRMDPALPSSTKEGSRRWKSRVRYSSSPLTTVNPSQATGW